MRDELLSGTLCSYRGTAGIVQDRIFIINHVNYQQVMMFGGNTESSHCVTYSYIY